MEINYKNENSEQSSINKRSHFSAKILDLIINHPIVSIMAGISACFLTIYSFLHPMYQEKIKIIEEKKQLEIKNIKMNFQKKTNSLELEMKKVKDNYENKIKQIKLEIKKINDDHEDDIKNIKIVIDSENNEFKISNIVSKNTENISEKAIPYKKDDFYAIKIPNWKYENISELQYLQLIDDNTTQILPIDLKDVLSEKYIHLWYKDKEIRKINKLDDHKPIDGIKQIFPHIYVQKVDMRDLERFGSIEHIIETMLTNHISLDLAIVSKNKNVKYKLLNLQKLENILFCNSIMILNNVEVNKKDEYEYYIRKKTLFVPVIETNSFYLVEIIIPGSDLREIGENFILTKKWLLNFRIIKGSI